MAVTTFIDPLSREAMAARDLGALAAWYARRLVKRPYKKVPRRPPANLQFDKSVLNDVIARTMRD